MIDVPNSVFVLFPQEHEIRCPNCNRLAGTILGLCMFVTKCKRCGTTFVWPVLETQSVKSIPPALLSMYVGSSSPLPS